MRQSRHQQGDTFSLAESRCPEKDISGQARMADVH
jgi:hypothetical protein